MGLRLRIYKLTLVLDDVSDSEEVTVCHAENFLFIVCANEEARLPAFFYVCFKEICKRKSP